MYHTCMGIFPQIAPFNCQQSIYEYQKATNVVTAFEMHCPMGSYRRNQHLPTTGTKVEGIVSYSQPQNSTVIFKYQQQIQKTGNSQQLSLSPPAPRSNDHE